MAQDSIAHRREVSDIPKRNPLSQRAMLAVAARATGCGTRWTNLTGCGAKYSKPLQRLYGSENARPTRARRPAII